jgi:hypothetical protein
MRLLAKLIILLSISSSLNAKVHDFDYWDEEFRGLSIQERSSLIKTFAKALQYNQSYSLTAIHFKESFGSRYMININSETNVDVGALMINTKEYLRKKGIDNPTKWETARAIEELFPYEKNFEEAKKIFDICFIEARRNWKLTYQYYNGWTSGSQDSKDYAEDIAIIVKVLKKYFNNPKVKTKQNK